jgi:hypothetical protein
MHCIGPDQGAPILCMISPSSVSVSGPWSRFRGVDIARLFELLLVGNRMTAKHLDELLGVADHIAESRF